MTELIKKILETYRRFRLWAGIYGNTCPVHGTPIKERGFFPGERTYCEECEAEKSPEYMQFLKIKKIE